jgi:hypothetical protein
MNGDLMKLCLNEKYAETCTNISYKGHHGLVSINTDNVFDTFLGIELDMADGDKLVKVELLYNSNVFQTVREFIYEKLDVGRNLVKVPFCYGDKCNCIKKNPSRLNDKNVYGFSLGFSLLSLNPRYYQILIEFETDSSEDWTLYQNGLFCSNPLRRYLSKNSYDFLYHNKTYGTLTTYKPCYIHTNSFVNEIHIHAPEDMNAVDVILKPEIRIDDLSASFEGCRGYYPSGSIAVIPVNLNCNRMTTMTLTVNITVGYTRILKRKRALMLMCLIKKLPLYHGLEKRIVIESLWDFIPNETLTWSVVEQKKMIYTGGTMEVNNTV